MVVLPEIHSDLMASASAAASFRKHCAERQMIDGRNSLATRQGGHALALSRRGKRTMQFHLAKELC
jgi:hypothetical protein